MTRLLSCTREVLDRHAETCGDRVLAFVMHPDDHEALAIVELWGIPVLGGPAVSPGQMTLLCESSGAVLIPPFETVDDLVDRWTYHP